MMKNAQCSMLNEVGSIQGASGVEGKGFIEH